VVEVLEPFEVGDGDSTGVKEDIGEEDDAFLGGDFLGGLGGRAVGGFGDHLALEFMSVELVEGLFEGGGDEDVALLVDGGLVSPGLLSLRVLSDTTLRLFVFVKVFGINSVGVIDRTVPFGNTDQGATVPRDEVRGPVSDVSESLHDDLLSLQAGDDAVFGHQLHVIDQFANSVVDSQTGGFSSTSNTTLVHGLSGHASLGINVFMPIESLISVLHPTHFSLACSHVGAQAIYGRAYESLLGELEGVTSGEGLDLTSRVLSGVEGNTAFSTTEGQVGSSALQGHQAG